LSVTARGVLCAGAATVCVLMLGPFQGAERYFGLNDVAAHAVAFYALACLCFMAGPRLRRNDLALMLVGLGAAAEVAQAVVGRDASVHDVLADSLGVLAAWTPSQIETLRRLACEHPDRPLGARDRRGASGRRTSVPTGPAAS
jgi:hypothetical protein